MTEPVARLFEPLERAGDVLPVPDAVQVRTRGRQIRVRRTALTLSAAGCLLLGGMAGVRAVHGGQDGGAVPAGPFVTTSPSDHDRHPGRSADGFLTLGDFGFGSWEVATGTTAPMTSFTPPRCRWATPMPIAVSPRQQVYEGITTEGASWRLVESVTPLTGDGPEVLDAAMTIVSGGCTAPSRSPQGTLVRITWTDGGQEDATLLAGDGRMQIAGTLLPTGAVSHAQAFAVVGRTLVTIDTFPGGRHGGLRLPGQTAWLARVTATALERATGTSLPPPEPNREALSAAAAPYVPPTQADPPAATGGRPHPRPGSGSSGASGTSRSRR